MVNIEIENQIISTCLLVIPDLCYDLILGTNWCGENNVEISYANQTIKINNKILGKSNVVFTEISENKKRDNCEIKVVAEKIDSLKKNINKSLDILSVTITNDENQTGDVDIGNDESFTLNGKDNELKSETQKQENVIEINRDVERNILETNKISYTKKSQNLGKSECHLPKRISTIGAWG